MCPAPAFCNSRRNAGFAPATQDLVRVTHPFHPLSGRQLVCIGLRYNRYGTRLLLRVNDGSVYSVPRQWTDLVAQDPEIALGEGRGLFRVADLLVLADLVDRLRNSAREPPRSCKRNYAAYVKENMARKRRRLAKKLGK